MNFDNKTNNQLQNYLIKQGVISNQTLWHIQTGGRTNKVWRLAGEEDYTCKLYLDTGNNPLFNNTPDEEYKCLLWLEGSDIAPKPYKFLKTPFGDVLLYNFIKGEIWSNNVETVSELLTRIRKHNTLAGCEFFLIYQQTSKKLGLK